MNREYIEKSFTKQDYNNFIEAFKQRKKYTHNFEDKKKKYEISVYCMECKNGMWKENFMGSFGCGYDTSGFGMPIKVDEIEKITYEYIIDKFCKQCGVMESAYQMSF